MHTRSPCAVSFVVPFNFIRFLISALWWHLVNPGTIPAVHKLWDGHFCSPWLYRMKQYLILKHYLFILLSKTLFTLSTMSVVLSVFPSVIQQFFPLHFRISLYLSFLLVESAFTFKTLLRHYANQPLWLAMATQFHVFLPWGQHPFNIVS